MLKIIFHPPPTQRNIKTLTQNLNTTLQEEVVSRAVSPSLHSLMTWKHNIYATPRSIVSFHFYPLDTTSYPKHLLRTLSSPSSKHLKQLKNLTLKTIISKLMIIKKVYKVPFPIYTVALQTFHPPPSLFIII